MYLIMTNQMEYTARKSNFNLLETIGLKPTDESINPYSYARILSEEESKKYYTSLIQKNNTNKKKEFTINYCLQNKDKLIELHNKYLEDKLNSEYKKHYESSKDYYKKKVEQFLNYNNEYEDRVNDFNHKLENVATLTCEGCGSPMRYIANFNFIGCTNYKNENYNHVSYNYPRMIEAPVDYTLSFEDFKEKSFSIPVKYIEDIRGFYNLPRELMPSIMYEFFYSIWGLNKLNPEISEDIYSVAVRNKRKSMMEESIIHPILLMLAKKVLNQPVIQYKRINDDKLYYCIPDFIASSDSVVMVIDVKKSLANSDLIKLGMYHQLIQFILNNHNDTRIVKSYQYFYSGEESEREKSITLKQLENEF